MHIKVQPAKRAVEELFPIHLLISFSWSCQGNSILKLNLFRDQIFRAFPQQSRNRKGLGNSHSVTDDWINRLLFVQCIIGSKMCPTVAKYTVLFSLNAEMPNRNAKTASTAATSHLFCTTSHASSLLALEGSWHESVHAFVITERNLPGSMELN